ncbi:MAG: hypothetical protein ABH869_00115 [Candidatus Omnitrophota bacterium]
MKTIWIDLLCLNSAIKAYRISKKNSIKMIYYVNAVEPGHEFYVNLLKRSLKMPVVQVTHIIAGEESINGVSLCEMIYRRLDEELSKWVSSETLAKKIKTYCSKTGYAPVKLKEHMREHAYPHVYRQIEIMVLSEKRSEKNMAVYVFRKTPFFCFIRRQTGENELVPYRTLFSHRKRIPAREEYFHDKHFNRQYYSDRVNAVVNTGLLIGCALLNNLLCFFRNMFFRKKETFFLKDANIGVELIQSRVRLDQINDIYWMKDSEITPDEVVAIELEDYAEDSDKALSALGIKRCRVAWNSWRFIKFLALGKSSAIPVAVNIRTVLSVIPYLLRCSIFLLKWDEETWIEYQCINFSVMTALWKSIYKQLGIRMLWSMYDSDPAKFPKAQALQEIDGIYCGSHWSNYPMREVNIQKCYDVLFAWGPHFRHNIFNNYPFLEVFETGYPLDYYFKDKKEKALALRSGYADNFILSYQDNVMAKDLMYSEGMQVKIHEMLISFLERYEGLTVFLKPKRKDVFDFLLKKIPRLKRYIDEGRIAVFLGETARTKVVPAQIGMASDLVVGLGISAVAAECYFAGTVSFHVDFTGFINNNFANRGEGKIVFRDIQSLERAICDRVDGKNSLSHSDYRKYYTCLDPFQDGKAYKRTGFILKQLQDALKLGMKREAAVSAARKAYDEYLVSRKK